jgi:hypothetical protein
MAQAAACSRDDDPGAGLGVCFAERRVDGYAGAEEGCGGCGVEGIGDGGDVVCGREDVLLECAGGVVAGYFLIFALAFHGVLEREEISWCGTHGFRSLCMSSREYCKQWDE